MIASTAQKNRTILGRLRQIQANDFGVKPCGFFYIADAQCNIAELAIAKGYVHVVKVCVNYRIMLMRPCGRSAS